MDMLGGYGMNLSGKMGVLYFAVHLYEILKS